MEKEKNYTVFMKFKCDCSIEIPELGLTSGARCEKHKEQLALGSFYRVNKKSL